MKPAEFTLQENSSKGTRQGAGKTYPGRRDEGRTEPARHSAVIRNATASATLIPSTAAERMPPA